MARFRNTNLNNVLYFFNKLYFNSSNLFELNSLLSFIFLIFCILLQKIDNFNSLQIHSKKINFKIFLPIFIILFTGLLSFGSSEKFIYFDF